MKTFHVFLAALLGLGLGSSAFAQTTAPGIQGTTGAPGVPTTGTIPGQSGITIGTAPGTTTLGNITTPGSVTTPVGTTPGTIYNNPTPAGTTSPSTDRVPAFGQPSMTTTPSTRSRSTRRTTTTNTTAPARP